MIANALLMIAPIFAVIALFSAIVWLSNNRAFRIGWFALGLAISCATAALPLAFGRPVEFVDAALTAAVTALIYFAGSALGIGAATVIVRSQQSPRGGADRSGD